MVIPYLNNRYSNTYLVGEEGKYCFLFDPSDACDFDFVENIKEKFAGRLLAIFLTHGHFDHFYSLNSLVKAFPKVKVYISYPEIEFLFDQNLNCGAMLCGYNYSPFKYPKKLIPLNNKDEVVIKDHIIKIFYTPFHTKGSSIFFIKKENSLFTGDTVFFDSIGRTDLPTGDSSLIEKSLKVFSGFKEDVMVYPGHGTEATLKEVRANNVYLNK